MDRFDNPLYRWVSPAPYMYRTGFEPIYNQGVTPQSMGEMVRQLYMNGLNNAAGWAQRNQHPNIQALMNNLRNQQIYNNYKGIPESGMYTGI